MTREDIIRMAKECGNWSGQTIEMNDVGLERFFAIATAAERNKVAQWMIARGYATGHGDTVADLLKELELTVREEERELCAQQKPWVKTYSGGKPNYTVPEERPRHWQELTDDEIDKLRHLYDGTAGWTIERFARAIEAKLKEKNHG